MPTQISISKLKAEIGRRRGELRTLEGYRETIGAVNKKKIQCSPTSGFSHSFDS